MARQPRRRGGHGRRPRAAGASRRARRPGLDAYQPLHAARADLLRRAGDHEGADAAYARAIALSDNEPQREELARRRAAEVRSRTVSFRTPRRGGTATQGESDGARPGAAGSTKGDEVADNSAVAYIGKGKVEVQDIDYPKLELQDGPGVNPGNVGRKTPHGVILKIVSTNICGSDQHMVRGRTTAPEGLILGHEITGEVIEAGPDVEFIKKGDLVSVPFNIACGRCRNCKEGNTGVCLNVNPDRPGSAYGYVDMGGWVGGQAEYVMVPYADFNLLKFPDKDQAMEKILDLTMLSDIFPTGYHGASPPASARARTVYVAGAGPVGLAAAALGAAARRGRRHRRRHDRRSASKQAQSFGCETDRPDQGATRCPTRSSRSSACRRSTRPSTASASRPAATAATPTTRRPRPC